jgi:hypothetical protein
MPSKVIPSKPISRIDVEKGKFTLGEQINFEISLHLFINIYKEEDSWSHIMKSDFHFVNFINNFWISWEYFREINSAEGHARHLDGSNHLC